MDEERNEQ